MRKFLFKLILIAVILTAIVSVINIRYIYIKDTNSTNKFKDIPAEIQICNFGSSHGANDYYYDNWVDKYTCFNFALSSQSLDYDWRIMQCYQDNISDKGIVFITISYFSFYGIDETKTSKFLSKNRRYYRFLPKEYIKNFDWNTYIYENKLPALVAYEDLLHDIIKGKRDEEIIDNAGDIDIERYAEEAYKRHLINEKLDDNGIRIINQEYLDSLYHMIDLCKKKGAVPILVTTPYLKEYTDMVTKKDPLFLDEFYGIIERIVADTGVKYFDFSRDERYQLAYDLFLDVDHLNHKGAIQFVDILMENVVEE